MLLSLLEAFLDLWQTFQAGCSQDLQQRLKVLHPRRECTYRFLLQNRAVPWWPMKYSCTSRDVCRSIPAATTSSLAVALSCCSTCLSTCISISHSAGSDSWEEPACTTVRSRSAVLSRLLKGCQHRQKNVAVSSATNGIEADRLLATTCMTPAAADPVLEKPSTVSCTKPMA